MSFKQKAISILILIMSLSIMAIGQEEKEVSKYYQKMKTYTYTLYKAGNYETFNMIANHLQKLADEEDTKWIPYYHASYAYIMAAFISKEKFTAEEKLNIAQNSIDKANKLSPNNDEIVALQGFLYQARVGINPGSRASEYIKKAVKEYDHARFMNPKNPRPYYLIGQILYRIPEEYGGNKKNACKHFHDAAQRFKDFKPRSELSPNWGEKGNTKMINNCK